MVPQSVWGGTQVRVQFPPTHASPERQALPQLPQFCSSLDVSAVHAPESSSPSPPASLEHAAKTDMPTRIEPPNSHLGRKLFFVTSDRMAEPFMMSLSFWLDVHGAAPGPEFPNSAR